MSSETSAEKYFQEIIDSVYDNDWSEWDELEGVEESAAQDLAEGSNRTIYFSLEDAVDVKLMINIEANGRIEGSISKSDYMETISNFFDVENEFTDYSQLSEDSEIYAEFSVEPDEYDQEILSETVEGLKSVGEAYHLFQEPEL